MGVRLIRYDRINDANNNYGDHSELINKDLLNQHPIYAITGLQEVLNILEDADYETNEWVKQTNIRIDNLVLEINRIDQELLDIRNLIASLYVIKGVEETYSIKMEYDTTNKILKGNVKIYEAKDDSNAIVETVDGLYVPKTLTEDTSTITWESETRGETLDDIFNNGIVFSHSSSSWSNVANATEANAWYWDANLGSFVQPNNTGTFTGFVTQNFYDNYTHTATLRSTNSDDDLNGLVIGFVFDENGKPHTLSAVVDSGGVSLRWAVVYDYMLPDQQVLFTSGNGAGGTIPSNRGSGWSSRSGIMINVTKYRNLITCTCSNWNGTELNEATKISFDLNSYTWGYLFRNQVRYGYCNYSQSYSYFTNIEFLSKSTASSTILFANVKVSADTNNAVEARDDGLYVKKFLISSDTNNALEQRADGYFAPGINVSSQAGNALEKLSDGTYYVREHSNVKTVTKTSHGFVVGDFIYYHPVNGYAKASAIDDYDSNIVGMVTLIIDENTFEYQWAGFFETDIFNDNNGYTQGMPIYISDTDPGKVTQEQPDISKAVGYPVENAGVVISIERGIQYNMEASIGDFKISANTYNVRSDGFIRVIDDVDYKQSLVERLLVALDEDFKTQYLVLDNTNQTVKFTNAQQLYEMHSVPLGLNLFIKAF